MNVAASLLCNEMCYPGVNGLAKPEEVTKGYTSSRFSYFPDFGRNFETETRRSPEIPGTRNDENDRRVFLLDMQHESAWFAVENVCNRSTRMQDGAKALTAISANPFRGTSFVAFGTFCLFARTRQMRLSEYFPSFTSQAALFSMIKKIEQ